jgi:pimeloyl-ACP methyl ester carboxylesterase
MKDIPLFPYFPVEFDKDAKLFSADVVERLKQHLAQQGTTDLVVVSHGWNNNMAEADALYEELLGNAADLINEGKLPALADRKFAVLGVLWPSKKFTDKELIPSGAAGIVSAVEVAELRDKLDALADAFDAPDAAEKIGRLKALLPKLEDSDKACREFAEGVRSLVVPRHVDDEDASRGFMKMDALDLFQTLSQPVSFAQAAAPSAGGAAGLDEQGGAAGLGDFISGALSGARNLLNYTTYFQMKERAGLVGAKGVNPIVRQLRQSFPNLRLHLVGHSFGGRLVTAAAAGAEEGTELSVNSMCLLQAAFSHYGLAKNWDGKGGNGFFRRVLDKRAVSGPVLVTCTTNDNAVGVAYPIASLVGGQTAAGLGDKDSKFGGIGRNGAQKTPEASDLAMQAAGQAYALKPGCVHNLNADRFIQDHGDVRNRNVAYAVLSAVAAS